MKMDMNEKLTKSRDININPDPLDKPKTTTTATKT